MSSKPAPTPPGLGTQGRALWRSVASWWAEDGLIPDPRERRLLADACAQADELAAIQAAASAATEAGQVYITGSAGQQVINPIYGEARAARLAVRTLMAGLGLEDPGAEKNVGKGSGSGSATTSTTARAAALVRHHGPKAAR